MLRVGANFFGKHRSILKSSGLEKQSAQLCEVHQWQNELAAVAARALPDSSTVQAPSILTEETNKGRFGRFFDFGEYVFDVQRSKPEFRKLSRQIWMGDSLLFNSQVAPKSSPSQEGHACCLLGQFIFLIIIF